MKNNRIKKARRQAENFVVDISQANFEEAVVDEQIEKIYRMKETTFVDKVIFVDKGQIVKIVRRT